MLALGQGLLILNLDLNLGATSNTYVSIIRDMLARAPLPKEPPETIAVNTSDFFQLHFSDSIRVP